VFGTLEFQKSLSENIFLLKHKLVDEDGRLINKAGQHIDIDGKILSVTEIEQKSEPTFEDDTL
jgi:hypothetical protein